MINEKTYKIRTFRNGKRKSGEPFLNYSLTIPTNIARELPEDMRFYCDLTDEGILFRPVAEDEIDGANLPAWAKS
jgi:hypothetical protein